MPYLAARTSRGKKYWSIVECRRINGKPRTVMLEYLGTAETLLSRLSQQSRGVIKSYAHGDSAALLHIAEKLQVVDRINQHVPVGESGHKPIRDGLTVGASLLLAAISRACSPASKAAWYGWCQTTSLEFLARRSFKSLDSQHFWDQMQALPAEAIPLIEQQIFTRLQNYIPFKMDGLLLDTSNFFTFIDSTNKRCEMPQRGRNKQKRYDLRQIGLALLVTRKEQLPLLHKTYKGNQFDSKVFADLFEELTGRLAHLSDQVADMTLIFDKGNNSKANFKTLDQQENLHYVASLVPSYFKSLIEQANKKWTLLQIDEQDVYVYRIQEEIWGKRRCCVVLISEQLKQGQIRGIQQTLKKKYAQLNAFKSQLENPRRRKIWSRKAIQNHLEKIVHGQFVKKILRCEICSHEQGLSFRYQLDNKAYTQLKEQWLGRRILVTNREEWSIEEIIKAYRCQSKIEYAFRNLKNPFHLAIRPQFHWTDQKLQVHFLICIIGYLLSIVAYSLARKHADYSKNLDHFMEDLKQVRLVCVKKPKGRNIEYQLEPIPTSLKKIAPRLGLTESSLRPSLNFSDYILNPL
jgi:transposase